MMKYVIFISSLLAFIGCKKEHSDPIAREKTSTKTVDFLVYTLQDFSDPRFDNLYVSIDLTVRKIRRDNNSLVDLLRDTTLQERAINAYPSTEASAIKITRQFTNVIDSIEIVNIHDSIGRLRGNQPPAYSTLVTAFTTGNRKRTLNVIP